MIDPAARPGRHAPGQITQLHDEPTPMNTAHTHRGNHAAEAIAAPMDAACAQADPSVPSHPAQRGYGPRLLRRIGKALALLVALPLAGAVTVREYLQTRASETPDAAATAASVAGKTVMAGGAAVSLGGLTANDWAVVGGLVVAVLGWITQLWFHHRRDQRAQREHDLRVALLLKESAGQQAQKLTPTPDEAA